MMKSVSIFSVFLSTLLVVSHGQLSQPASSSGDSLRLNSLQETTNWDLLEDLFLYHNAIRFFHNSRGIQFNRTLTEYARLKALIFAWYDGNVPADNGDIRFGENVHHSPIIDDEVNATDIMDSWYFEEEPLWNYQQPRITPETKEFAQIAWNSTRRFGCGQAVSRGKIGGTYTVCYYDPPMESGLESLNVFQADYEDESTSQSSTTDETTAPQTVDSSNQSASDSTTASSTGENASRLIKSLVSQNRALLPNPLAQYQDIPL